MLGIWLSHIFDRFAYFDGYGDFDYYVEFDWPVQVPDLGKFEG